MTCPRVLRSCLVIFHEGNIWVSALIFDFCRFPQYPIFIFHDRDIEPAEAKMIIQDRTSLTAADLEMVQFILIEFQFPPNFDVAAEKENGIVALGRFPGYHHMISFWFKHIFHHPAIAHLDYYWRLDTDSSLVGDVDFDVFKYMRDNNLQYAHRVLHENISPAYIKNLFAFLDSYIQEHDLDGKDLIPKGNYTNAGGRSFYNNFGKQQN